MSFLKNAKRLHYIARLLFICAVLATVVVSVAYYAYARPGGGHGYRGGSHSSGGSRRSSSSSHHSSSSSHRSSGSSHRSSSSEPSCQVERRNDGMIACGSRATVTVAGDETDWVLGALLFGGLVYLIFGIIPAGLIAIVVTKTVEVVAEAVGTGRVVRVPQKDWVVGVPKETLTAESLRKNDPNFSIVLFEDFLYSLYALAQRARGTNNGDDSLGTMSAYLSSSAISSLQKRGKPAIEVFGVIVGSMQIEEFSTTSLHSEISASVVFEANYTARHSANKTETGYVRERWTLVRSRNAISRPRGKTNVLTCPCCGAPHTEVAAGHCSHCNQVVNNGAFDWLVKSIELLESASRGPMLVSGCVEQGTDSPTVYDPRLREAMDAFVAKDPEHDWSSFERRVDMIFHEFQIAWSARDLKSMRPFLSDCLFQTQSYWVEAYKQQRLRNVTERARITRREIVKISSDLFYDAVTVRLWGTGLDYTVDENNKLVGGSTTRERDYTEYWTLIRGSERKGRSSTEKTCPNCCAPLNINMAGVCEHCNVKITSGEFDWVLSKIEQDDSYRG